MSARHAASLRATVLGSAAGGGFPQWNCGCAGCVAVRAGKPGFAPRTQDSIAVRALGLASDRDDDARFALINASPDVLAQIQRTPALWPRGPRHSPIACVVLTNGDLDHVLGLFSLRESQPLAIYATASVWRGLEESVFLRTLRRFEGQLVVRRLTLERDVALADAGGAPIGVTMRAFAAPGKLPVHLVDRASPSADDNVALVLSASDEASGRIVYAAACAAIDARMREALGSLGPNDAVLFDGTFFREDELVRQGLSRAVAKDMAHLPVESSLPALSALKTRAICTHINNTNPILDPSSEEHRAVISAGCSVAFDGMELEA